MKCHHWFSLIIVYLDISKLLKSSDVGMNADNGASPHSIPTTLSVLNRDSLLFFSNLSPERCMTIVLIVRFYYQTKDQLGLIFFLNEAIKSFIVLQYTVNRVKLANISFLSLFIPVGWPASLRCNRIKLNIPVKLHSRVSCVFILNSFFCLIINETTILFLEVMK